MIASQTPSLFDHILDNERVIPATERAYFEQRLRSRILNLLLSKFVLAHEGGLTKAELARRIGRTPEVINRWLGAPSNLTIDTVCDLLLGIAGEELTIGSRSPLEQARTNYSRFDELCEPVSSATDTALKGDNERGTHRSKSETTVIGLS